MFNFLRRKRFKYILVILLFLVSSVYYASYSSGNLDTIKIQNTKVRSIPYEKSFIGANWFLNKIIRKDLYLNPKRTVALADRLKDSGINIVRYPGGNPAYLKFWDVSYEDLYKAQNIESSLPAYSLTLKEYLDFCRNNGLKTTIQLNTNNYFEKKNKKIIPLKKYKLEKDQKDYSTGEVDWKTVELAAKNAAEEVKWAKSNYPDTVLYWELGNEEFLRETECASYTGDEYAKVASIFIREIKKVSNNDKFLLTVSYGTHESIKQNPIEQWKSMSSMYGWNTGLLSSKELSEVKNDIYAICPHIYPFYDYSPLSSYKNFKSSIVNNPALDTNDVLNKYKELLDKHGFRHTKIFINEFNATNYKDCPYSHTWLGALGNTKLIMSCASNPYCYHMDYHEIFNQGRTPIYQNVGYGLFHYAKEYPEPIFNYPVSNAISLLNKNLKGEVLKSESNNKNTYTLTIKDNNKIKVILLNLDKQSSFNISFEGFKNIVYTGNTSLGIGIPEDFTIISTGEPMHNPSEVRVINELANEIKINRVNSSTFSAVLPSNTLSVLTFNQSN